ncbi:DUF6524 family protein [Arenibaculum sp.]|jgi:hypothetical protein|uniref:DUF6524 family protein n=1 Tax=Arenibaculum sp. TaxID=2865862 RepID=UPI002E143732|nr:DUF6524 family protein [Arenibaculum sp.]
MPRLGKTYPIKPLAMLFKRWLLCATVVFASYNPSGNSYFHWVRDAGEVSPLLAFTGVLLLIAALAIMRMAFLSLGYFGVTAALTCIVMMLALGAGLDLFELADVEITTYMLLFWATLVLAVGVSWSLYQGRISGERDILRTPP